MVGDSGGSQTGGGVDRVDRDGIDAVLCEELLGGIQEYAPSRLTIRRRNSS